MMLAIKQDVNQAGIILRMPQQNKDNADNRRGLHKEKNHQKQALNPVNGICMLENLL